MHAGKARAALAVVMRFDGTPKTRQQAVEDMVRAGATVAPPSNTPTRQRAGRRLVRPGEDGSYLTESVLGKVAMDYAAFLASMPRP